MQLTLREIYEFLTRAGAAAGEAAVEMNALVSGYSIDSRTLNSGDLFFAIRGPHFDGHDFVKAAFEKGAGASIVDSKWATSPSAKAAAQSLALQKLIVVHDTPAALRELGAAARTWWGGEVVAITGSAGKTTTKEICAALLASRRRVYKSEGNLNNLFGAPLTLLRLDAGAEIAVLELAMSAREEIRQLARVARPNVGLVTNVNPVHLQFFSSIDEIALAKRELVEELDVDAVAVLNADDPRVSKFAGHSRAPVFTYGESAAADLQIKNIRFSGLTGSEFELTTKTGASARCRLRLLGKHNVWNAAAATAAALQLGMSLGELAPRLESIHPTRMRGEVLRFAPGFTVINDTYNSNPRAFEEVVSAMAGMNGFKRKIVVAGEMLELGPESRRLHADCGKIVAGAGIDLLMAVQGDAQAMAEGARSAGMKPDRVFFFPNSAEAGESLKQMAAPGDLILLKGSRGVKMEVALESLRQKFTMEET